MLEPALLAILLFIAIPALAGALIVMLVERWSPMPWASRRLTIALLVASVAATAALALAVVMGVAASALERSGLAKHVLCPARVLVPIGLVAASVVAGIELAGESGRILA